MNQAMPQTTDAQEAQTPAEPQAQGAAPAFDLDAFAAKVAEQTRNSMFAELRKAGVLGKQPKSVEAPANVGPAPAQPDMSRLRQFDRAIARTGQALQDAAIARMESAFVAESPSDADAWVREYLGSFGVAAPQPTPSQTATAPARVGPPASDGGAPPPSRVPLEQQDILRMSEGDRTALVKQIGPAEFSRRLLSQASGKTYRIG
jgi:hypothetical protein